MGGLGWAEILMILVIALIIFGPRKLPELGKSLAQGLAHFRRASEEFKRTWEEEVETEKRRIQSYLPDMNSPIDQGNTVSRETSPYDASSVYDPYSYGDAPAESEETSATETEPASISSDSVEPDLSQPEASTSDTTGAGAEFQNADPGPSESRVEQT